MRVYEDCYELMSEIRREVYEMGTIVRPKSMQNKNIEGDINFETREILNYSYCLLTLNREEYLFNGTQTDIETTKKWAIAEFNERVNPERLNPGEAWEIRKEIWEEFLVNGKFDYAYGERMNFCPGGEEEDEVGNLERVIEELLRNPDTRQGILPIWDLEKDGAYIGGRRRVPCSMYYQLIIRENRLHIIYNQRSADVVTHFGNDVFLAWQLKEYVTQVLRSRGMRDLKPGYLYHNIASLHSYRKDWDILKNCIEDEQGRTR